MWTSFYTLDKGKIIKKFYDDESHVPSFDEEVELTQHLYKQIKDKIIQSSELKAQEMLEAVFNLNLD